MTLLDYIGAVVILILALIIGSGAFSLFIVLFKCLLGKKRKGG